MNAPTFNVSLDKPPHKRYADIISQECPGAFLNYDDPRDMNPAYVELPFYVKHLLHARDMFQALFGNTRIWLSLLVQANQMISIQNLYMDELQGIVDHINEAVTGQAEKLKFSELVIIQYAYEFNALCTSVAVNVDSESGPLHIRTMDWPTSFLSPLTMQLEFYKGGQILFKSTSWLGLVGIFTGMRMADPSKPSSEPFSISLNYRRVIEPSILSFVSKMMSRQLATTGQLIRQTLEQVEHFGTAVQSLRNSPLISPCYFTIVGSQHQNGVVITRGEQSLHTTQSLRTSNYIVQTNTDHLSATTVDPNSLDVFNSISRMLSIENSMLQIVSRNTINYEELWKMMGKEPVLDKITVYATLMNPSMGYFETRLPHYRRRKLTLT
ncbi:hypothetical protein BC833DRAFT_660261 [Globomyces pollinis-pini]|nr:hypothetical protein BC833DRAFT_660261 [Globomyces pollinis-pini]